jgi:hypothetical protein
VIYNAIVDTAEDMSMGFTVSDGTAPARYVVTRSDRFQLIS